MIEARFPDAASAKLVFEMLKDVAFVNEGVRSEGVRIDAGDDGSMTITVVDDEDARLTELLRLAGAEIREIPDRPGN